jgi:hypothetical protein
MLPFWFAFIIKGFPSRGDSWGFESSRGGFESGPVEMAGRVPRAREWLRSLITATPA